MGVKSCQAFPCKMKGKIQARTYTHTHTNT